MNYSRATKNYNRIFNTAKGSRERDKIVDSLSAEELHEVYQYELDLHAGRIKQTTKVDGQEEHANMSYETWKKKMNGDCLGKLQELSAFAQKFPKTYERYRERYQEEREQERRFNNMRKVCS